MALSKQERKEMARKAMEKRGSKKPDGSETLHGVSINLCKTRTIWLLAKIDADAKKLSE